MRLIAMLQRMSRMAMVQPLSLAEEALTVARLPSRLLRRHSAFLYYSRRHHAHQRREA